MKLFLSICSYHIEILDPRVDRVHLKYESVAILHNCVARVNLKF